MMRGLWCVAMVMVCGCEREPVCTRSKGAELRSEIISGEKPTARWVACELGAGYASPELSTARLKPDRADVFNWTRFYDGIELDIEPVTSKYGDGWITRFHPELAGPERIRRGDLIGDAKAIAASRLEKTAKAHLKYVANFENKQRPGTRGDNAADFDLVIASWQLAYDVEGSEGGAYVNAYTGALIRDWSNSID